MSSAEHAAAYDRISETYDQDFLGLLTRARAIIAEQVAAHMTETATVVDCAIGTGKMVEAIGKQVRIGQCIGNDISPQMLELAKANLDIPFTPTCSDALKLRDHIPSESASLLLCHFLYDYCHPADMIPQLSDTVAPGGFLSSATSTKACYDDIFWSQVERHPVMRKLFSIDENVAQSHTPESPEHHLALLDENGFETVEHRVLDASIVLDSPASLWSAVYHSGWFVGYLSQFSPLTLKGIRFMASILGLPGIRFYPFTFNAKLSVVLARKLN